MKNLILTLLLLATPILVPAAQVPAAQAQDRQPNNLLGEDSPYLQQHLYNPVDWYPWGPEAFAKARRENSAAKGPRRR